MSLDQFFESPWYAILVVIGSALVLWWWVRNIYKAATDPTNRTSDSLFKTFILGKPLIYLVLGLVVVIPLVIYSYYVLSSV